MAQRVKRISRALPGLIEDMTDKLDDVQVAFDAIRMPDTSKFTMRRRDRRDLKRLNKQFGEISIALFDLYDALLDFSKDLQDAVDREEWHA